MSTEPALLGLRDRAFALISGGQRVADETLLQHVYGGAAPTALRERLLAPLVGDPRFARGPDGYWTSADAPTELDFTALALTTTAANPARGRIVCLAALRFGTAGGVVERFAATVHPGGRVPRYVAQRAGCAPEILEGLPGFESIVDELEAFLGQRPICAQEAALAWSFVNAEARRAGRVLRAPELLDVNDLADRVLDLRAKPSLGLVAQQLGISSVHLDRADEEARVVALVVPHLMRRASEHGVDWRLEETHAGPLHQPHTARELPDRPGVYVMRDASQAALYVGKARRLRERVTAYIHRPLGATRRLEGLTGAVQAVEAQECATDLEALILEEREIRRLQPRFNTVRQQRLPRTWLRLPAAPPPRPGKRQLAPVRLELASGPEAGPGDYLGPFRNEAAADYARALARAVFDLDTLRRTDPVRYVEQLACAWRFLRADEHDTALAAARAQHARAGNDPASLRSRLAQVRDYDPATLLLPADPRHARYAVVRRGPSGVEGFLLDRCVLHGRAVLEDDDVSTFAANIVDQTAPRTTPEDLPVVLRWLGAQRPGTLLLPLAEDALAAADAIADAALTLLAEEVG
jgi:DNA polymerase III epsilon subunit-like protein